GAAKVRRQTIEQDVAGDRRLIAIMDEEVRQLPALEETLALARKRAQEASNDLGLARDEEARAIREVEEVKAENARAALLTQAREAAQRELRNATSAFDDVSDVVPRAKYAAEESRRALAARNPEA